MNPTIEISFKTAQAYSAMCKPLCQELKLPQTAFDIPVSYTHLTLPTICSV